MIVTKGDDNNANSHKPLKQAPYIVGISGGSGSGKTYFIKRLIDAFEDGQLCVVSQDNYYKPLALQPRDENDIANFDTPFSIDFEAYLNDILAIKLGEVVRKTEYTFNNPKITPRLLTFQPAPILVLEGIFALYDPKLLPHIDLKIFIEANEEIKLNRRISRDNIERGYDIDDVLYRYENHVSPTFEKYIKPCKKEADIVINNHQNLDKALAVIIAFLKEQLRRS